MLILSPSTTTAMTAEDLQGMIDHWLSTPVNGYLGESYGSDPKSLLQKALHSGMANDFIRKMREDIPILQAIPSDQIDLYSVPEQPDKMRIFIMVASMAAVEVLV